MVAIIFANETRAQIAGVDRVNRALRALARPSQAPSSGEHAAALFQTLDQLRDHVAYTKTYRPVEVHVYRPSPEIVAGLAGFLIFERSFAQKLIDAGYADAVNHDPQPVTSATHALHPSFLRA